MDNFEQYVLSVSDSEIALDTLEQNQDVVLALLSQASLSVNIYTRDLDANLFDNDTVLESLSRLARDSHRTQVRILLMDESQPVKNGHRLVELARRLSSSMEIRIVNEDYRHRNHAFVTVDQCGYSFREFSDRYESVTNFNDPGRTRELLDEFNEIWEHSHASAELRRLHI